MTWRMRVWIVVLIAGCDDRGAPPPVGSPPAPAPPTAAIDAAPPVDATVIDATVVDATVVDAAPPRRRTPTKAELRKKCLDECERRNRYTDCADENGMTACPCHCP